MKWFFLLLLSAATCAAQFASPFDPAFARQPVASAPSIWLSQESGGDYWDAGKTNSQYIADAVARNIVQVDVAITNISSVTTYSVWLELRSAVNGGGTLYGTSATNSVAPTDDGFMSFTFVVSKPASAVYLTMREASNSTSIRWGCSTSDVLADSVAYNGVTERAGDDFCFRIWTQ